MRKLEGTHACTGVRVVLQGVQVRYQISERRFKVDNYRDERSALKAFRTLTQKKMGRKPDRKRECACTKY